MPDASTVRGGLGRRRWLVLGVIGLAQLMVVLDLTVMNIALPSAQRALHFTTVDGSRSSSAFKQHRAARLHTEPSTISCQDAWALKPQRPSCDPLALSRSSRTGTHSHLGSAAV